MIYQSTLKIIYLALNAVGWTRFDQRRILNEIGSEMENMFNDLFFEARQTGEPLYFHFKFLNIFHFIYFKGHLEFLFGLMQSWKEVTIESHLLYVQCVLNKNLNSRYKPPLPTYLWISNSMF